MVIRTILAATLLVAGCAALETQTDHVDRVVAEALSAARAAAPEQKTALATAQAAFAKDRGQANRLRLATLLAVLSAPLRDEARALELLEPLAKVASPFGRFAGLLSAQLTERQRLVRELERVVREREKADKERDKREEALRQQLDAVQSIERGIIERQEKLRRQTPSAVPRR